MVYQALQSDFVKDQLKKRSFSRARDRKYVDELRALERYVQNPPKTFLTKEHFHRLRAKHPEAYLKIVEELNPDTYEAERSRLYNNWKTVKQRKRELEEQEWEERQVRKKEWVELGGKP